MVTLSTNFKDYFRMIVSMNVSHFVKICQVLMIHTNLSVRVSLILGHCVYGEPAVERSRYQDTTSVKLGPCTPVNSTLQFQTRHAILYRYSFTFFCGHYTVLLLVYFLSQSALMSLCVCSVKESW